MGILTKIVAQRDLRRSDADEVFVVDGQAYCVHGTDEDYLGGGAHGQVRKASSADKGMKLAAKTCSKDGDLAEASARNEVRISELVRGCPYLSTLKAVKETKSETILFFPLGKNGDFPVAELDHPFFVATLSAQHRAPEDPVRAIFIDALKGLRHMHGLGILHRDIKLPNIVLFESVAKLVDFGISSHKDDEAMSEILGTPTHMAPEALDAKPVFASDIFSLGFSLCEAFFGFRPNDPRNRKGGMQAAFATANIKDEATRKLLEASALKIPCSNRGALIDAICEMTRKDPAIRPTAAEALNLPFFKTEKQMTMQQRKADFETVVAIRKLKKDEAALIAKAETAEAERAKREAQDALFAAKRATATLENEVFWHPDPS